MASGENRTALDKRRKEILEELVAVTLEATRAGNATRNESRAERDMLMNDLQLLDVLRSADRGY